jgi:hypothetical protein
MRYDSFVHDSIQNGSIQIIVEKSNYDLVVSFCDGSKAEMAASISRIYGCKKALLSSNLRSLNFSFVSHAHELLTIQSRHKRFICGRFRRLQELLTAMVEGWKAENLRRLFGIGAAGAMGPSQCWNDLPGFGVPAVTQKLQANNFQRFSGF